MRLQPQGEGDTTACSHVALLEMPRMPGHQWREMFPEGTKPLPRSPELPWDHSCSGAQQQPLPPRITLSFSASVAPVPRSPAGFLVLLLN